MKKIRLITLPIALTGLLLSQTSFAGSPDASTIARECRDVAQHLEWIVGSQHRDPCAGDVVVAAAYINAAELKIRHERYDEALIAMHYGDVELREVAYTRAYCANFSPLVKPALAKTIRIISELEEMARTKA